MGGYIQLYHPYWNVLFSTTILKKNKKLLFKNFKLQIWKIRNDKS